MHLILAFYGPSIVWNLRYLHNGRHSENMPETQSRKLLTCCFSFEAFAALAKAFSGNEFEQNPRVAVQMKAGGGVC